MNKEDAYNVYEWYNELEFRLSPIPQGYIRVRAGADVLILDRRSDVVVDILCDIERESWE